MIKVNGPLTVTKWLTIAGATIVIVAALSACAEITQSVLIYKYNIHALDALKGGTLNLEAPGTL